MTARADQGAIEQRSLLELLRYADRLEGLGSVLAALDDAESLQVHIGEPVHVAEGETVEQSMLVVNADVDVDGRIVGDVIVVDGRVRIAEGASIDGDVQLLDARITNRGEVSGDIERLRAATEVRERELSELREQIRADIERELERGVGRSERSSRGLWSPFRNVASAVGGILENLLTFGVLVAIGAILLHFGGGRLETVAATARAYPARSAAVGMAGAFLAFPTWLLGVVVLAVTIIGIPVAIAWAPLFPLFIGLLALGGALAVAVNIGEWVAENRVRGFEWAAEPNTLYRMAAGLLAVTLVFVVANALQIAGSLLGFLHGLLSVVGTLAVIAMTIVGFGAMLLTRGGARPDLVGESFSFDDWRSGWRSEGYRSWGAGSAGAAAGDYATDLEDFASDVTDSAADVAHEAAEDLEDVADDAVDAAEDIVDTAAGAGRDAVADVEAAAGEAADAAQAAAEDLEDVVEEVFDGEVESDRPKPDRDDA